MELYIIDAIGPFFSSRQRKSCKLGYNAIAIDDHAHLIIFDFYPPELQSLIKSYRIFFRHLFKEARRQACESL